MQRFLADPVVAMNLCIVFMIVCFYLLRNKIKGRQVLKTICVMVITFVVYAVAYSIPLLRPSVLTIHAPGGTWDSITLHSKNLRRSLAFSADPVNISPIEHGEYLIEIHFKDKSTAWAKLFHLDAGARRTVDVTVARITSEKLFFTQTVNGDDVVFQGKTRLSEATSQHPFQLERVP